MRYKQYLTEKRKNNIIVVDVQPIYQRAIHFDMYEFVDFLEEQGDILYFHNGPETTGGDDKNQIIDWLNDFGMSSPLYHKLNRKPSMFYDKGYAFFRNWMDFGMSEKNIIKAVRYMMSKKVNDSRDIEPEVWAEMFPDEWSDNYIDDPIYLPDVPINTLKKWSGSYMVGGGKDECLKEVQILMSIFNIKYKLVKRFVY